MNKKIFNTFIFICLISVFDFIYPECGNFRIEEDYFADQLIGFYINSIDINTGDTSVEYFRYRIIQENNQTDKGITIPKALHSYTGFKIIDWLLLNWNNTNLVWKL